VIRAISLADTAPTPYAWPVRAEGLTLRAGLRLVASDLDFHLGVGVHGVLGPNGAGKTTVLRALATVLQPHAGTLELLGVPVHTHADLSALRRNLGYLPQEFGYYKRFTVREFVEYLAWLKQMPARDIPAAAQRALDRVALSGRADSKMKTLSGGMLRRVGIAQAIVNEPTLLLLDEPTAGLDPEQRTQFRALLRDLGAESCVVLTTHLVEDVAASCAGVLVLDEGRLIFQGSPADLAAQADADTDAPGSDSDRGYAAVLRRHRAGR
jgi:ABC-2 type transport system ATP-binding protein